MSEKRKKYDREFREGAVRIVRETGKPIAQVARDLGVHEGTQGNWVNQDREAREGRGELTRDDMAELKRLRSENAELRMERDVLPGSRGGISPPGPHRSGREPLGSSGSCRLDHQAERHQDQWANRPGHAMVTLRQDALALVKARNRSYFRRIQRNK